MKKIAFGLLALGFTSFAFAAPTKPAPKCFNLEAYLKGFNAQAQKKGLKIFQYLSDVAISTKIDTGAEMAVSKGFQAYLVAELVGSINEEIKIGAFSLKQKGCESLALDAKAPSLKISRSTENALELESGLRFEKINDQTLRIASLKASSYSHRIRCTSIPVLETRNYAFTMDIALFKSDSDEKLSERLSERLNEYVKNAMEIAGDEPLAEDPAEKALCGLANQVPAPSNNPNPAPAPKKDDDTNPIPSPIPTPPTPSPLPLPTPPVPTPNPFPEPIPAPEPFPAPAPEPINQ